MSSSSAIDFNNQAVLKQDLQKCLSYGVVQGTGTAPASGLTYEEFTLATTFTGTGGTTASGNIIGVKVGNLVFLRMPQYQASWTSTATNVTALDARFRPAVAQNIVVIGVAGGAQTTILAAIGTGGVITLSLVTGGAFTTSTNGTIAGTSFSYSLI